jgi:hypothetical protein
MFYINQSLADSIIFKTLLSSTAATGKTDDKYGFRTNQNIRQYPLKPKVAFANIVYNQEQLN